MNSFITSTAASASQQGGGAGTGRYTPADFAYNGRVALALVPCLATTGVLGGRAVITILALGGVAGYMMDVMQYRDGAYACGWVTLLGTAAALAISLLSASSGALPLELALVGVVLLCMLLCAMWTSLQFKYFQMHNPAVALAFERLVVTGALPAAAVMHTLGLSLFVDASDLPYYMAAILTVLYCYLAVPLPSSFISLRPMAPAVGGGAAAAAVATGKAGAAAGAAAAAAAASSRIQSVSDSALLALVTCTMPPLVYAAVHWELLTRHAVHAHSLLLLGCAPLLVLALVPAGLWWLPGGRRTRATIRALLLGMALLGTVIGFEGRVVFHAFGQYIKLPPPWDWITVTACMLGVAGIMLAAQLGVLGSTLDVTVAGSALLLCTTAGALATGVPFHWLPAPLVASCGLALFFDSRSLREYIVFVGGAFMTGVWFVLQHFWLLDISVGGLTLRTLCKLALAALLPALMVPGLVYAAVPAPALDALLLLQASLLCVLEEKLYVPSHSDWSGEPMYPGYLVVATSILGVVAARMLASRNYITSLGSWVAHGLYTTKTVMLVLPEASLVLPSAILVLTATAPLFLTPLAPGSAPSARRRVRTPLGIGLLHAMSTLLALMLARFAIFDVVQFFLSSRPPEGLLLGVLLCAAAASLAPLVVTCYPNSQVAQRVMATLALSGVLLVLLQPPMPLRGGARCPALPLALCPRLWDERHVPLHDAEDAEVWGSGLARKEHWPRWLLFAALVVGVGAGALGGSMPGLGLGKGAGAGAGGVAGGGGGRGALHGPAGLAAALRRLVLAALVGVLVGGYVALEVVPRQLPLQVLVLASCMAVVAFVCLLPMPAVRGPLALPALAAAWFMTFGVTMLLQAELPPPEAPAEMRRMFPDSHRQVEDEIAAATRASLLAVFASQAALLALALKLHVVATLKAQDASIGGQGADAGVSPAYMGAFFHGAGGHHGSSAAGAPVRSGAELFCGVVPMAVFSRWGRSLKLDMAGTSGCGLLLQRLGGAGLSWAPSLGSGCALVAYAMCVSLNVQVTGGTPEALFLAAPLLLLLQQDPLIAPGLTAARRYTIPLAATCLSLFICSVTDALGPLLAHAGLTLGLGGAAGGPNAGLYGTRSAAATRPLLPLLGSESVAVLAAQQVAVAACCLPGALLLSWAMWAHKPLAPITQVWAGGLCALALLLSPQPATWYLAGLVLLAAVAHQASVKHQKRANAKII